MKKTWLTYTTEFYASKNINRKLCHFQENKWIWRSSCKVKNMTYVNHRVLFNQTNQYEIMSFFKNINGTGDHHVKQNKPDSEKPKSCVLSDT